MGNCVHNLGLKRLWRITLLIICCSSYSCIASTGDTLSIPQESSPQTYITKKCNSPPLNISGGVNNIQPGCFDYYVFTQIWLPEACISVNNHGFTLGKDGCNKLYQSFSQQLTPHSLVPNFFSTQRKPFYPMQCTAENFDFAVLSLDTRKQLDKLYPPAVRHLAQHEWSQHGTCEGKSQEQYFNKIITYNSYMNTASKIVHNTIGKTVSYQELVNSYGGKYFTQLQCNQYANGQYLNQISTYWSKTGIRLTTQTDVSNPCLENKPIHIRPTAQFLSLHTWQQYVTKKHATKTIVGFDIDDTLLFSSPVFYYMEQYNKEIKNDSKEFWIKVNSNLNRFSLPKKIGHALIEFHKKRGDVIYFITARKSSAGEELTNILQQIFTLPLMQPVIFTGNPDKTDAIKQKNIQIYYGDADQDILSAHKAGAQGVRIMRAANSSATDLYPSYNGAFGEIVILESYK